MKTALALLMVLALSPSAFAQDTSKKIDCKTADAKDEVQLTLKTKLVIFAATFADKKISGRMMDPVMTAISTESFSTETPEEGRRDSLWSDETYKPRKFLNTLRFDMSKLISTSDYADYRPMVECAISLLVPEKALDNANFNIHAIVSCDQGGFSQDLACSATAR